MSESENERVVREITEALNRRDLDAVMDHIADDVTYVEASGNRRNKEELRRQFASTLRIFPDSRFRVDHMVSQGNTVAAELTMTGTHKGEWAGIPATNKKVEVPGVHIYDFEAGKVKLWKLYYNVRRLRQQLLE